MRNRDEMSDWCGCEVVDRDGDKVGKITEIFVDHDAEGMEWATVKTGMFGMRSSFVPLDQAMREGDMIRVPYEKERIKDAPNVDADGELDRDEEQRLYAHYEIEDRRETTGAGTGGGDMADRRLRRFARDERTPAAAHEERRA